METVKEVKKTLQENTKAIDAEKEQTYQQNISPKSIVAEVHFDENTIKAASTEDKRRDTRQKEIRNATRAAVVAACLYAAIAAWQGSEMRKASIAATRAANTADKTMVLDERAWVAVTAINGTKPEIGKKLTFTVHFIDTGKSPARNLVVHPGDEILDYGATPNFSNEGNEVRLGILSPGSERTYENFIPMTNGNQELAKDGVDYLKKHVLSIHGRITYDDIFGCSHWITYAGYLKPDWSGYAFYPDHNDTDNDYQPCQEQSSERNQQRQPN
ncbi:MAG: hypothetical protein WCD49_14030 [Candidatus Acidiferrales bacterium]